jgi:8-oxo-dGTP diphosphatase
VVDEVRIPPFGTVVHEAAFGGLDSEVETMRKQGEARHLATPRVLLFLERDGRWLLIRGAGGKWWAGRWNGLGGSVEPGENILAAARRETREETGLEPERLELAAVGHVSADPPVLLFVFVFRGTLPPGEIGETGEGTLRWFTRAELEDPALPLMPDLPVLLPRILSRPAGASPFYFSGDPERPDVSSGPA